MGVGTRVTPGNDQRRYDDTEVDEVRQQCLWTDRLDEQWWDPTGDRRFEPSGDESSLVFSGSTRSWTSSLHTSFAGEVSPPDYEPRSLTAFAP